MPLRRFANAATILLLTAVMLAIASPGPASPCKKNPTHFKCQPAAPSSDSAPVNTSLPTVSGTAKVDETLTASEGTWLGSVANYAYQWHRCDSAGANCAVTSGATAKTYTLVSADEGRTLRVAVTASNSAGSATATSDASAVVAAGAPANTEPPAISGTAKVGNMLTASEGTWLGSPTGYAYQWYRCDSGGASCAAISGATAKSYGAVSADEGRTIRVVVTASNSSGSASATRAQTEVLTAPSGTLSTSFPASYFNGPLGTRNILPPKQGAFLGLFAKGSWTEKQNHWISRENYLGRKLDFLALHYWTSSPDTCYAVAPFSQGWEQWVADRGSMPIIQWTHGWTLDAVNAGHADACLRDVGARFAAWGKPILLRTYWEFNGSWFRWSGTGTKFISAWKRTVDVMRSAGATNVGFVWCPDEGNFPGTNESYPGDTYVDWVCSDKYNWNSSTAYCRSLDGAWHAGWCEFEESFRDGSSIESLFGPKKPYMVGETGSAEGATGQKGQWFRNARDVIKARFPYLKAFVYFDVQPTNGHPNWRLDTTEDSLRGFRDLASDVHFNTRG